ncbi:MAG: alpha/beta fold hydrolase [Verrucomicrobiota bacterium]|nr:alpha/beta fold hydrolase [Verrucomicrobiota bacterium]
MQAARESGSAPHALFYLHGFNVSFEDAAIRAAQIGYDLNVQGATAFFSWPSRGSVTAYPADEATIETSERAITDFVVDFATNCGAEKVHVIAHSMGNRALLRALQRIAAKAETRGKVKFGQIFLAAPDVDRDLFLDLALLYPEHSERTTLYASDGDLPVHLSAKLHDAPRAGYFKPYTVAPGVDTVAVPDFDIDLLGHSYFAQADALLHDMYDLIRLDATPGKRQRLMPGTDGSVSFWKLRR